MVDPEFTQANKALDAFVKTLRKDGEIAGVVHKETLTREIVEKLFQSGQLGPADSKNPSQLPKYRLVLHFFIFRQARSRKPKKNGPNRCWFWEQRQMAVSITKSTAV